MSGVSREEVRAAYRRLLAGETTLGDIVLVRELDKSSTKLQEACATGVFFDVKNNELWVANFGNHSATDSYPFPGSGYIQPPSITVYPRTARGDVAPARTIQGPRTQLNWPTALAVNPENGELFVANDPEDSILVFAANANGDVAPIR